MRTLPISQIKDHLSEVMDAAHLTGDQVTVTKNGIPTAVIVGIDEWDELQERLFWLSQEGIHEDIASADSRVYTESEIRAEFGRRPE
jgi:prevent-host-death family protein